MPRLKCQLSDQKQTPVYFPIYDKERLEQENASPEDKEKVVNILMGIDVIIALVFLICSIIVLQSNDINFVTNILENILFWMAEQSPKLQKSIQTVLFSLFVGPIILWELYKKHDVGYIFFIILAVFFLISCLLADLGGIVLLSGYAVKWGKKPIVLCVLVAAKIALIQRWFYK